jgi:hypothetical protein
MIIASAQQFDISPLMPDVILVSPASYTAFERYLGCYADQYNLFYAACISDRSELYRPHVRSIDFQSKQEKAPPL